MKHNNTNLYIAISFIIITLLGGFFLTQANIKPKQKMTMQNTNNQKIDTDLTFLRDMIEHHMGAVDMAKQLQKNSKRPELLVFANSP